MTRLVILAALPLLATPTLARDKQKSLGEIAGPTQQCLSLSQVQGPAVWDDHTIAYRQNGRRTWVTHPVGPCPSLRTSQLPTLIVDVYGDQVCRNDRFRVLTPGSIIPGPYCRFDGFTPYDKPSRR